MSMLALVGPLSAQPALAQRAAITNVTIEMSRTTTRSAYNVRAEVTNPNDFAVREINVRCTMLDARGNKLKVYESTILATLPAKQKIVMTRLDIGAWPERATKASCTSSSAQRVLNVAPSSR
jgi:hypothetical protein